MATHARVVPFNPSKVEDLIDDLQNIFDGAKVGRYDDAAKKAAVTEFTDCPILASFVRGWVRHGVPTRNGYVDWVHATYSDVKYALRQTYPQEDEETQAAADLDELTQEQRIDPHLATLFQIYQGLGTPINPESQSKKTMHEIIDTLSDCMDPRCQLGVETIQSVARDEVDSGTVRRIKHLCKKLQMLDKTYYARAKRAGVEGGAYWVDHTEAIKSPRKPRKKQTPGESTEVMAIQEDLSRMLRLEQRVADIETTTAKAQTDMNSTIETFKSDVGKRLTIQESKTDANQEVLQKIWSRVSGEPASPIVNNTAAYPSPLHQQAPMQPQPWNAHAAQQQVPTWPPAASGQQATWGPLKGKGKGGKGGGKGGKTRGPCWICKQYGHIAANCPNYYPTAPQYVGSTRINAVVGTLTRAIDAYGTGGTAEMSKEQLDHQMVGEEDDGTANVLHIADSLVQRISGSHCTASACGKTDCQSQVTRNIGQARGTTNHVYPGTESDVDTSAATATLVSIASAHQSVSESVPAHGQEPNEPQVPRHAENLNAELTSSGGGVKVISHPPVPTTVSLCPALRQSGLWEQHVATDGTESMEFHDAIEGHRCRWEQKKPITDVSRLNHVEPYDEEGHEHASAQPPGSETNDKPIETHEESVMHRRATEEHMSWCEEIVQKRSCKVIGGNTRFIAGRRHGNNPRRYRLKDQTAMDLVGSSMSWVLVVMAALCAATSILCAAGSWDSTAQYTLPEEDLIHAKGWSSSKGEMELVQPLLSMSSLLYGFKTLINSMRSRALYAMTNRTAIVNSASTMLTPLLVLGIVCSGYLTNPVSNGALSDSFSLWSAACSFCTIMVHTLYNLCESRWVRHWSFVMACEDQATRYRAMTVKWLSLMRA